MRLTAYTDYSLRVLIYLATRPDRRPTISEIAVAFGECNTHGPGTGFTVESQACHPSGSRQVAMLRPLLCAKQTW